MLIIHEIGLSSNFEIEATKMVKNCSDKIWELTNYWVFVRELYKNKEECSEYSYQIHLEKVCRYIIDIMTADEDSIKGINEIIFKGMNKTKVQNYKNSLNKIHCLFIDGYKLLQLTNLNIIFTSKDKKDFNKVAEYCLGLIAYIIDIFYLWEYKGRIISKEKIWLD